jgi:hypothetical protein
MSTSSQLNIPSPKKTKKTTKGAPPAKTQTPKNLKTPHTGELRDFNFKVPLSFKREFQKLALDEDKSYKDLLMEMFEFYKNRAGD